MCLPKDTSSLEGVLLTPTGLLVELWIRARGEYFTADGLVHFSDPPPLWSQGQRAKENGVISNILEITITQMILRKIYLIHVYANNYLPYVAATFWQKTAALKSRNKPRIT